MDYFFIVCAFAFGAIMGSFVNVVALRFGTGRTMGGRSRCVNCDTVIAWYDLVPVASYIFLRGRCRNCQSRLSLRYPAIELSLGFVFVAIALRIGVLTSPLILSYYWSAAVIFAAIVLYDIRHKIIPDLFVGALAFLALMTPLSFFVRGMETEAVRFFLAGPAMSSPFFFLWFFSRGRWMGLGDAKLALPIGWLLGLSAGAVALVLSFWIGALVSIGYIFGLRLAARRSVRGLPFKTPRLTMKSEVPFAPFLVAGTLVTFLFEIDHSTLLNFFVLYR